MTKEEKKAQLLVKMSTELHKKFKIATTQDGESMTAVVLRLIEEYLVRKES